ncbi:hypothetical protein DFH09DRAFT_1300305 [Mycena vulgaris]|nr:hypothetical protein DFH09DRAFT_1300305 [Mycena vulgaris]
MSPNRPPSLPSSLSDNDTDVPSQATNRSSPAAAAEQDSDEEGTAPEAVALTSAMRAHRPLPQSGQVSRVRRRGLSRVGALPCWTSVRCAACAIFSFPSMTPPPTMPPARHPPSSSAASSDDADIEKQNMTRSAAAPKCHSDNEDAGSYVPEAVLLTHAKRTAHTQEAARTGGGVADVGGEVDAVGRDGGGGEGVGDCMARAMRQAQEEGSDSDSRRRCDVRQRRGADPQHLPEHPLAAASATSTSSLTSHSSKAAAAGRKRARRTTCSGSSSTRRDSPRKARLFAERALGLKGAEGVRKGRVPGASHSCTFLAGVCDKLTCSAKDLGVMRRALLEAAVGFLRSA